MNGFGRLIAAAPAHPVTAEAAAHMRMRRQQKNMEFIERRNGGLYVAGSRISLATVIYSFQDGESPETIQRGFPSLTLGQVYGAIAYYLNNPEEAQAYLAEENRGWAELEQLPPTDVKLHQRLQAGRPEIRQR